MKKRYGKFMAYLFFDAVLGVLWCPYLIIRGLFIDDSMSDFVPSWIIMLVFSIIILFFVIRHINKRTPKGERVGTYFRCLCLGVKVAFKITLCILIVFIPFALSHPLSVSEKDNYNPDDDWYREGKRVHDDNGNEFTVGRSGDYVKDKEGNWHKVNLEKGERFAVIGNEKRKLY
ncbi:MAG: hypothetical protein IKS13_10395 [Ruminococcus sp.]|nr:hypothetical protein [Ruminococcus sp.]